MLLEDEWNAKKGMDAREQNGRATKHKCFVITSFMGEENPYENNRRFLRTNCILNLFYGLLASYLSCLFSLYALTYKKRVQFGELCWKSNTSNRVQFPIARVCVRMHWTCTKHTRMSFVTNNTFTLKISFSSSARVSGVLCIKIMADIVCVRSSVAMFSK